MCPAVVLHMIRFNYRLLLLLTAVACTETNPEQSDTLTMANTRQEPASVAPFRIPEEKEITDSVTLASIRRGRALLRSTRDSLPGNVRASLSCVNCHIADGTLRDAMPLVGSYARFPQYRGRSGKVDIIEDRINDCFERSMNGKALVTSGRDMHDIVAYLAFLSTGFPVGVPMQGQGIPKLASMKGDTTRGHAVFTSTCAVCHGPDGHGTHVAPPLWGPASFNIGAGMARLNTAAGFIHHLMPRDRPGILTPQQAYDVAAYVTSRPRPDFKGKENDWPRGGAPPDVAYPTRAAKKSAPK